MTIFFPDISSYEAGLIIQPGTVAVIAKATEGTYYRDAQYANFKAQAAHVGAVFSAYHFLKAGNGAGQADYCHAMVGSTPVMLDVETEGTSKPTVADCADFISRMRALGGSVWGAYFPQWYWQQVGGNLASLGVAVVASNYTAYSDTGPGWAPYGGVSPALWQYTDKQPYGGQTIDFNAYKGTVQQLAALINGTSAPAPTSGGSIVGTIPASIGQFYPEIAGQFPGGQTFDNDTALIWADGGARAAALYAKQCRDEVTALKAEFDALNGTLAQVLAKLGTLSAGGVDESALAADVVHGIGQKLAGA